MYVGLRLGINSFISFQGILAGRCLCCQEASIRLKKLFLQKGVISSVDILVKGGAPRHACAALDSDVRGDIVAALFFYIFFGGGRTRVPCIYTDNGF